MPSRFVAGLTPSVTNLFNTDRVDVLGALQTERLIWVSATYQFNGLRF